VQISCPQCHTEFTRTRRQLVFCSPACWQVAHTRTCQHCGQPFKLKYLKDDQKYCKGECHLAANLAAMVAATVAMRQAKGRTLAPCGWGDKCLFPGVPVSVTKSKAHKNKHHPECWEARGNHAGGRTGTGNGKVLWCQECGREIGYRPPSGLRQKLCSECHRGRRGGVHSRVKSGEQRPCPICGTLVYLTQGQIKANKPGCCSPKCGGAWRRRKRSQSQDLTCQACGTIKRFPATHLPRAIARGSTVWTCAACRQPQTAYQERTCEHCQKSFRARIRVAKPEASRFCSLACRHDHYKEVRRRRGPCAQCGGPIKRRGQANKYCSRRCTGAAKMGRPNRHRQPSPAELSVLEQWAAGVRGVRPLATAAGVSKSTVQDIYSRGRLVEPVAVARSA